MSWTVNSEQQTYKTCISSNNSSNLFPWPDNKCCNQPQARNFPLVHICTSFNVLWDHLFHIYKHPLAPGPFVDNDHVLPLRVEVSLVRWASGAYIEIFDNFIQLSHVGFVQYVSWRKHKYGNVYSNREVEGPLVIWRIITHSSRGFHFRRWPRNSYLLPVACFNQFPVSHRLQVVHVIVRKVLIQEGSCT